MVSKCQVHATLTSDKHNELSERLQLQRSASTSASVTSYFINLKKKIGIIKSHSNHSVSPHHNPDDLPNHPPEKSSPRSSSHFSSQPSPHWSWSQQCINNFKQFFIHIISGEAHCFQLWLWPVASHASNTGELFTESFRRSFQSSHHEPTEAHPSSTARTAANVADSSCRRLSGQLSVLTSLTIPKVVPPKASIFRCITM